MADEPKNPLEGLPDRVKRPVVPARRKREKRRHHNPTVRGGESITKDSQCGSRKADGGTCTLPAGYGTDHTGYGPCSHHMGSTPAGRKSGAMDMAEELMVFYGKPLDTDPITALLDEVRRTAGHVHYLGARIGKFNVPLNDAEGNPAAVPPEVAGWLAIYHSERQQLVRASKAALDAGVNERLVQIAEHQGNRLADAVEEILNRLGLSDAQWARVPDVVPNVLRGLLTEAPVFIEGTVDDQQPN